MSKQQWQRTKRERRFKQKEKARKARRRTTKRLPWWRRLIMKLRGADHYYDPLQGTYDKDGYLR